MSPNLRAKITNIDYNYGAMINVTVKAMDLGFRLKKGERTRLWENMSIREIATEIAEMNGLGVSIKGEVNGVNEIDRKIKRYGSSGSGGLLFRAYPDRDSPLCRVGPAP